MVFMYFIICQQFLLTRVVQKNSRKNSLFKDYQKLKELWFRPNHWLFLAKISHSPFLRDSNFEDLISHFKFFKFFSPPTSKLNYPNCSIVNANKLLKKIEFRFL